MFGLQWMGYSVWVTDIDQCGRLPCGHPQFRTSNCILSRRICVSWCINSMHIIRRIMMCMVHPIIKRACLCNSMYCEKACVASWCGSVVYLLRPWGHSKQRNAIAILAKGNKNSSQIQLALANLAKIKYTV